MSPSFRGSSRVLRPMLQRVAFGTGEAFPAQSVLVINTTDRRLSFADFHHRANAVVQRWVVPHQAQSLTSGRTAFQVAGQFLNIHSPINTGPIDGLYRG